MEKYSKELLLYYIKYLQNKLDCKIEHEDIAYITTMKYRDFDIEFSIYNSYGVVINTSLHYKLKISYSITLHKLYVHYDDLDEFIPYRRNEIINSLI